MESALCDIDEGPSSAEQARIGFARAPSGRSYIASQKVSYPFHLGRTLQLPGDPSDMASVYLQSCSGGIFAGEGLWIDLKAGPGSRAHVGTGAATIAHAMHRESACQTVSLDAEQGAFLEYWPQSTILFHKSRLHSRVNATIRESANIVTCDSFCFHTSGSADELFDWYRVDLNIFDRQGDLLAADRLYVEGPDIKRGLMGKNTAHSNILIIGDIKNKEKLTATLRAGLNGVPNVYPGVCDLPNGCGLCLRILALDNVALKQANYLAWSNIRLHYTGLEPKVRRL